MQRPYAKATEEGVFDLKIPMQRQHPTSTKKPFWYFSHCKYYKLKLLTPIGFYTFKIASRTKLHKMELPPMKFFY